MTSEANSSHSPLYLGRELGKGKFTNFKNSFKINKNSYNNIFRNGDQEKKEIYISGKKLGG